MAVSTNDEASRIAGRCMSFVRVQGTADRLRCVDVVSEEDLYTDGSSRRRRSVTASSASCHCCKIDRRTLF